MNNIPTEKLGKSKWLTRTDIRKLEKMYKCKPKHERIKNLGNYLLAKYLFILIKYRLQRCRIWQYRLWSFQGRDTKLKRFLAKDQLYSNEITKF